LLSFYEPKAYEDSGQATVAVQPELRAFAHTLSHSAPANLYKNLTSSLTTRSHESVQKRLCSQLSLPEEVQRKVTEALLPPPSGILKTNPKL